MSPKLFFSRTPADSSTMSSLVDLSHSNESILGLRQNKNHVHGLQSAVINVLSPAKMPASFFTFFGVVILVSCD